VTIKTLTRLYLLLDSLRPCGRVLLAGLLPVLISVLLAELCNQLRSIAQVQQLTRISSLCTVLPPISIAIATCAPIESMSVNKTESLGVL
jgi:hypothetical protein